MLDNKLYHQINNCYAVPQNLSYAKLSSFKVYGLTTLIINIFQQNDEQIKAFFMKIDYNSDGLIDWVCPFSIMLVI